MPTPMPKENEIERKDRERKIRDLVDLRRHPNHLVAIEKDRREISGG